MFTQEKKEGRLTKNDIAKLIRALLESRIEYKVIMEEDRIIIEEDEIARGTKRLREYIKEKKKAEDF